MSTPAVIVAAAQRKTGNTDTPDATCYELLNDIRDELYSQVVSLDQNIGWKSWTTNSMPVVGQNEISLKKATNLNVGQYKIEEVYVDYGTRDGFTKLDPGNFETLDHGKERYVDNSDGYDPFFIIADNSIFIYPVPTINVVNGIRLEGPKKPKILTAASTEDDIGLPVDCARALKYGLAAELYYELENQERGDSQTMKYEKASIRFINAIKIRSLKPILAKKYDNSYLT